MNGELVSENYCDCLFYWSVSCSTVSDLLAIKQCAPELLTALYVMLTWHSSALYCRHELIACRYVEVHKRLSTAVRSGSMQRGTEREVFWVKQLNVETVLIFYSLFWSFCLKSAEVREIWNLFWDVFRRVRKICENRLLASSCMFVRLSIRMGQIRSHWTDFH